MHSQIVQDTCGTAVLCEITSCRAAGSEGPFGARDSNLGHLSNLKKSPVRRIMVGNVRSRDKTPVGTPARGYPCPCRYVQRLCDDSGRGTGHGDEPGRHGAVCRNPAQSRRLAGDRVRYSSSHAHACYRSLTQWVLLWPGIHHAATCLIHPTASIQFIVASGTAQFEFLFAATVIPKARACTSGPRDLPCDTAD